MKKVEDISLKIIWTNDLIDEDINSFVNTQESVFSNGYTLQKFNKKYFDNIYGESLIILSYLNNECIGAMAFWRNDINELKAYQPCEMAVLNNARGYGVFSKMNNEGLKFVGKETLLYNFPNNNSLPFYKKIGWKIHSRKRYKLLNPLTNLSELNKIDDKYLSWLLNDTNLTNLEDIRYIQIYNKYYLLKKRSKNMYIIIAEIQKEGLRNIKKARLPILLHYSSKGYFGRGIVTVTRSDEGHLTIPLYKIGPLF